MMAKVTMTCCKCGRKFVVVHKVDSKEAKIAWENWIRKTVREPYCNSCRMMIASEKREKEDVDTGPQV